MSEKMKIKKVDVLTLHPGESDDMIALEGLIIDGQTVPLFGHGRIYSGESITILNYNGALHIRKEVEDTE